MDISFPFLIHCSPASLRKMVLNTYSFAASLWIATWMKKVNVRYFFLHMMWYMYMPIFHSNFPLQPIRKNSVWEKKHASRSQKKKDWRHLPWKFCLQQSTLHHKIVRKGKKKQRHWKHWPFLWEPSTRNAQLPAFLSWCTSFIFLGINLPCNELSCQTHVETSVCKTWPGAQAHGTLRCKSFEWIICVFLW